MRASIKDVAQRAGVSVTSVSRVLNGEKYVSEALLEKVNRAIEELDYSPSHIARSLKTHRTNTIGIIVPDITNHFFSTILRSIEETASALGYTLLVGNIAENLEKEMKYLQIFKEMRIDGIIIMHQKFNDEIITFFNNANMPILFSSINAPSNAHLSVRIDDYRAAFDATEYLIRMGHTKIAYFSGDLQDIAAGRNRYSGYLGALQEHGIKRNESFIKLGDYKLSSGRRLMEELLRQEELPTVIFAATDDMAVGALNGALDHGLRVPDDISIIGFDGSAVAEIVRPSITSMQQPMDELGRKSVEYIHQLIVHPDLIIQEDIILQHWLVERESFKPRA
ncbi:LacI family DNA-binding transcriptional regulator [Paenibacillus sp. PL2-23]|uniref:LacI family DNA-binding transcriptional regulator n=1 Tax=Paenibacillus sp. PL2-23 TaxID=2100729 RepID=UPI0030FB06D5